MRRLALLLLLTAAAACAPPPDPSGGAPLLDPEHALEVLVEARELALPPDPGGNRFVSGWWPRRTQAGPRLLPDTSGALLEGVHLGTSPRHLRLAVEGAREGGETVEVAVAGRPPLALPLTGGVLEVPLPADLPRGRFPIQLQFPADSGAAVRGAGFDRALPAGAVTVTGESLVQGGVSLVELVRPLATAATVVGRFVPPAQPEPGQRFELWVKEDGGDERLLWAWEEGWRQRWRGAQRLEVAVTPTAGWLRLRLLAATPGPPATWEGLALGPAAGGERAGADAAVGVRNERGVVGDGASPPAAPTVSPPAAPQVVVLYAFDALRADAVGHLGGNPAATPVFDGLARSGATFRQHLAPAPNTLPSTKTLLTGRIWRQRGGWVLASDGAETLAEAFRRAGYRTGLFSGNVYVSPAYGLARGFEVAPPEALYDSYADRERPPYNDNSERVHAAALAWLRSLRPDEKAFLYLHPVLPHNPYDPPAPYRARFAGGASGASEVDGSTETLLAVRNQRLAVGEADRERIAGLYRGGLAWADAQLGELLAALAQRYPPEHLLVAVTSDHGEELFDHGGVLHGYTLYDEQLHIPLVLRWPGAVAAGRVVEEPTDTADLHAALRSLAAAVTANGDAAPADGSTLWGLLEDRGPVRRLEPRLAAASSVKGGIFMARTPRYKVVWAPRTGTQWGMGEGLGRGRDAESVFDLRADPGEHRNLAGLVDAAEVRWLRSRLLAWAQLPEPDDEAAPPPADEATRRKLEALGYAN